MIKTIKPRPKRSLRTILAIWFLSFAIIPIVFLTFYSLQKFQQTIDNELVLRLKGNASEIQVILKEYQKILTQQQVSFVKNQRFQINLKNRNSSVIRELLNEWIEESSATRITVYSHSGDLISEVQNEELVGSASKPIGENKTRTAIKKISLNENIISQLRENNSVFIPDYSKTQSLDLSLISPVQYGSHLAGFIKLSLTLDASFLKKISERMQIQAILLEPSGRIIVGSHPDFLLYKSDFFSDYINLNKIKSLSLILRNEPYGFIFTKTLWGDKPFQMALAVSKKNSNEAIQNLRTTYFTIFIILLGVVVLFVFAASDLVLRPLSELVEAIQDLHLGENIIELPIKSDNEIGQLTTSFNDLSRRILLAQNELKDKIKELESSNNHLIETQGQLVQSAKMASLGNLVAGVAHELNNPIGFIFSNMSHLRDYSNKLLNLIEVIERDPAQLTKLKEKYEIDYIKKDLPKLISSCEDGARRTKEIVIGLKNFSRVEDKSKKHVNLHESIDSTLNLLSSEFKNRIEIKKNYSKIPLITCNQNQINQVLMNILSNAFQAIKGTGTVWINTYFNESKKNQKPFVSVSVQDSGTGIPSEVLNKIFDPFFTTKSIGQGTGLGLAISYGIITAHGGNIEVNSKIGVGSEFIITLPIEPPAELDFVDKDSSRNI